MKSSEQQILNGTTINAASLPYRVLNEKIHEALETGARKIVLKNVLGQRYIGDGLTGSDIELVIHGVPGNDLAAFMDGPRIEVYGNAQDGVANTMNAGEVIIHGHAGDIVGHSMRGGRVFIQGNAGYRTGIHMKAYRSLAPVIIIGGTVGDFVGEYMAGGILIVLGLHADESGNAAIPTRHGTVGDFVATGMHGGRAYIRGEIDPRCLGKEVRTDSLNEEDKQLLRTHLTDFCRVFGLHLEEVLQYPFTKLYPYTHRPYGTIYAY